MRWGRIFYKERRLRTDGDFWSEYECDVGEWVGKKRVEQREEENGGKTVWEIKA